MEFGEKLKALRNQKELTQSRLSEISGISESAIRKYEKGEREPKFDTKQKIAAALDVDISEFLITDHIYNDITANANKYCNDTTYSANYTIEKSQELINLYFKGVTHWINDKLFSEEEKRVLNEHFCELLTRYKSLIEAILNSKLSYNNNEKRIQQYAKTLNTELTHEQQKALYLGNNVDRQMNDLSNYIQFLPIMFSNADKKEGE